MYCHKKIKFDELYPSDRKPPFLLVSDLMRQNIHGRESGRRIWLAKRIGRPEFGDHTRVPLQADASHGGQAHGGTIPAAVLPSMKV